MHRKADFFPNIPNVADLAIFIALFKGKWREDFLEALYYIKIGNRPRNANEKAINADSRNDATIKSYFNRFLAIRGSLTINVKNRAKITQDSFKPELLLQEERDWLEYLDENKIFK
jgi:hypothetical protein